MVEEPKEKCVLSCKQYKFNTAVSTPASEWMRFDPIFDIDQCCVEPYYVFRRNFQHNR